MNDRYEYLDGLRGILAAVVMMAHGLGAFGIMTKGGTHPPVIDPFIYAQIAVSTFFVLSGFILGKIYFDAFNSGLRSYGQFIAYRAARIAPLNVFLLLAIVPVAFFVPPYPEKWTQFVRGLLFLNGPWGHPGIWNSPAWSLGVEWHLYLIFPFVAFVAAWWRLGGLSLLALGFILLICHLFLAHCCVASLDPYCLVRGAGMFIAGMGISRLAICRRPSRLPLLPAVALLIILAVALGANYKAASLLTPFLVLALLMDGGWSRRVLSGPAFRRLGEWSYSIYMVHMPLLLLMRMISYQIFGVFSVTYVHAFGWQVSLAAMLIYCALGLAVSGLTFKFVECPARRFVRALADKWFGSPVAPAARAPGPRRPLRASGSRPGL